MNTITENVTLADGDEYPKSLAVLAADGEYYRPDETVVLDDGDIWPLSETVQLFSGSFVRSDDDEVVGLYNGSYAYADDCRCINDHWHLASECTECTECDASMVRRSAYHHPHGGRMCESCYDELIHSCEDCGCEGVDDDMTCDEWGNYRCDACGSRRRSGVTDYGDRTADTLRSETSDKLRFGIELEVEANSSQTDGADWIRQYLGTDYCVLKEDGSLSDDGIEIVTRPDSVAVHGRKWAEFFANRPERQLASWTTGRCGMHVHVSKSALSQLQLGKILVFVNEPTNQELVSRIAGRTSDRWARTSKKKISDVRYGDERYVALNITNRTAEFRIFKGTLNKRGFMKNLEFCQALVDFCGPANRSMSEAVSASAFVRWLPRKTYPHLHEFLTDKGFIAPRPGKKGK